MKDKPEKKIQDEILAYLTKAGYMCWRNNNVGLFDVRTGKFRRKSKYQMLGVSDILGCFNGMFLAIEVKSKAGKATDYQKKFMQEIRDNGGIAFIARSVQDVRDVLFGGVASSGDTLDLNCFRDFQNYLGQAEK